MLKRLFYSIFLVMAIGSLLAQTVDAPMISVESARDLLASGKDVLLLDVRTRDEYVSRHIPGAILFTSMEINKESAARVIGADFERILIVYCSSGGRSKAASALLLSLGYKNVWNMGGIYLWPYGTVQGESPTGN